MSRLIQSLEVIVIASEQALPGSLPDPPGILIDDPTDAGPSSSWGTGPLYIDPNTGSPVTGADLGTRAPSYGSRKRRKHGSGDPWSKNVIQGSGNRGTAYCTLLNATFVVVVLSGPDIPGFGGQHPVWAATLCILWTTIDAANFPAEVAAQKAVIAAKAPDYIPIVNQKAAYLATAHADDPSSTYDATFVSATVFTPSSANACDFSVTNYCNDPNF